jgi:hypothetical protein
VAEQLIPELRALGDRLAAEPWKTSTTRNWRTASSRDRPFSNAWKRIYWDEFIPFAHGVRYLGMYYNDAVHPQDPYEFVGLLRGEDMLASQRNRLLQALAQQVQESPALQRALRQAVHEPSAANVFEWEAWASQLSALAGGPQFLEDFQTLLRQFMDVAFGGLRLIDKPTTLLRNILEMASQMRSPVARDESDDGATIRGIGTATARRRGSRSTRRSSGSAAAGPAELATSRRRQPAASPASKASSCEPCTSPATRLKAAEKIERGRGGRHGRGRRDLRGPSRTCRLRRWSCPLPPRSNRNHHRGRPARRHGNWWANRQPTDWRQAACE